jgi:hypothetical protein
MTRPNCTDAYVAGLRRRRAATFRTPPLECGCVDPWTGRRHETPTDVSERQVDAYREAALTLLALGYAPAPNIPVMRVLWRRNGADRDLVRAISQRWEVAA